MTGRWNRLHSDPESAPNNISQQYLCQRHGFKHIIGNIKITVLISNNGHYNISVVITVTGSDSICILCLVNSSYVSGIMAWNLWLE